MIEVFLKSTLDFINHYGVFGIFIIMFLENVGIPLPTEAGFIAGQAMVVSGRSEYAEIFLIILAGKTFGSLVSFFLGKYFVDRIKLYNNSNRLKKAQEIFSDWLKSYDSFAVFISRLVGYIRPWSSYLAGIGEVKFIPFIIYNVLGSAVIIIITMFVLGGAVEIWRNHPALRPFAIPLFLLFFFGFWIGLWIYKKIKESRSK